MLRVVCCSVQLLRVFAVFEDDGKIKDEYMSFVSMSINDTRASSLAHTSEKEEDIDLNL